MVGSSFIGSTRMRSVRIVIAWCGLAFLAACTRTVYVAPRPQPQQAPGGGGGGAGPTARTLGIPGGHLPRPGQCRIWIPGTPPGRQPHARSRTCVGIRAIAPAGSWIVYRPTRDRRLVHVREVDRARAGVIIIVRLYDVNTGNFVRDARPDDDEPEGRDEDRGRGEDRRSRPNDQPGKAPGADPGQGD